MSLTKNAGGQNFTFELINTATNGALTGATVSGFTSRDGGAQASIANSVTELGNGVYNCSPTTTETNGNCVGFLMTASGGLPTHMMFLTLGLHRNVSNQHITFAMFSNAGVADPSASISVFTSKDGGAQASGGGTITNLGNGQYDYAPTQAETKGANVSFLFRSAGDTPINISIFTVS